MHLSDLVLDEKKQTLSTTKIWMHIANVTMTWVVLHQPTVEPDMLLFYGAIVGGSYVGGKLIRMKYGKD